MIYTYQTAGTPRGLTWEGLRTKGSSHPYGRIACHAFVAIKSTTASVKENRSDVTDVAK